MSEKFSSCQVLEHAENLTLPKGFSVQNDMADELSRIADALEEIASNLSDIKERQDKYGDEAVKQLVNLHNAFAFYIDNR